MRKTRIILTLALALCFAGTGVWAQEAKTISVAFLVPLTGGGAFYGKVMRDVGKGIIDEMNKEGIKGFGKIKVRVFDTATDPAVTARKIERAVHWGANFVWGGFASGVEKMMMSKAEELHVPCLLTNEHTYEACLCKTRFGITPVVGTVELGKICAKYFQQENVKTYAIIGADYGWGHTWDKSLTFH
ncbi:ABC transporter substrate-binding protein, partial [bacterium]|nr:ABC transporter substrate-binding protein [bacterium]